MESYQPVLNYFVCKSLDTYLCLGLDMDKLLERNSRPRNLLFGSRRCVDGPTSYQRRSMHITNQTSQQAKEAK